ncbi:MAG: AAA family ATPase [Candidatus Paceibacterota bacterium]|jgi:chromosome segregation protein
MRLKTLNLNGFKSFAQKTVLEFESPIVSIVGPNGSGKSNVVEAIRFVLGEQSMKSMRGRGGADLVFKGSKNLPKGSRASVTAYFNNTDKIFKLENDAGEDINLNYDVVSISREVYADGVNKYILNGSEVRLKDIHGMLASVHIGSSGHHIISQGEADRILNASVRDRKEMVEDALGLRLYQYKIKESERKLERTSENMKEVGMLRRENAPHLKFLEKQVDKLTKAKEMQQELGGLYAEYLKKEEIYLVKERDTLTADREKLAYELKEVSAKIRAAEGGTTEPRGKTIEELRALEQSINLLRGEKNELERKLGRIEGQILAGERNVKVSGRCPMCGSVIADKDPEQLEKREHEAAEFAELKKNQTAILAQVAEMAHNEKEKSALAEKLRENLNREMETLRDLEREKFAWKVREQELHSALELIKIKEDNLRGRKEAFENELKEGAVLLGVEIGAYKNFTLVDVETVTQEELKRKIERIKIKLEDTGLGSGAEIMKEYEAVAERDQFLGKELADLEKSIDSLKVLIAELKEKIDTEFRDGVKKINQEFQEFFAILFGGGHAALSIVTEVKRRKNIEKDEDEETLEDFQDEDASPEQGIEINVSLPHKKVKDLHAFSGGERSLTSIALLFAMSQVNPPPFLVLDETDAALDEANSRKYGDMLEKLSKASQLIVVTHNRETMSRAGILYGVTIGSDGASKLLSVKFEEATQIAK